MGTWGSKILEDDFAMEVVSSFVELLYEGIEAPDATDRIVSEYGSLDSDEHSVFWLSLAQV